MTVYPVLSKMARDYRAIIATSAPSKSVFSIAGLIITKRRSRLLPQTMNRIMYLKSWSVLDDEMIEATEAEVGDVSGPSIIDAKMDQGAG